MNTFLALFLLFSSPCESCSRCPLDSFEYINDHIWTCPDCLKVQVTECDYCVYCGCEKIKL